MADMVEGHVQEEEEDDDDDDDEKEHVQEQEQEQESEVDQQPEVEEEEEDDLYLGEKASTEVDAEVHVEEKEEDDGDEIRKQYAQRRTRRQRGGTLNSSARSELSSDQAIEQIKLQLQIAEFSFPDVNFNNNISWLNKLIISRDISRLRAVLGTSAIHEVIADNGSLVRSLGVASINCRAMELGILLSSYYRDPCVQWMDRRVFEYLMQNSNSPDGDEGQRKPVLPSKFLTLRHLNPDLSTVPLYNTSAEYSLAHLPLARAQRVANREEMEASMALLLLPRICKRYLDVQKSEVAGKGPLTHILRLAFLLAAPYLPLRNFGIQRNHATALFEPTSTEAEAGYLMTALCDSGNELFPRPPSVGSSDDISSVEQMLEVLRVSFGDEAPYDHFCGLPLLSSDSAPRADEVEPSDKVSAHSSLSLLLSSGSPSETSWPRNVLDWSLVMSSLADEFVASPLWKFGEAVKSWSDLPIHGLDGEGRSAMGLSAETGEPIVTMLLWAAGADPLMEDTCMQLPLNRALFNGRENLDRSADTLQSMTFLMHHQEHLTEPPPLAEAEDLNRWYRSIFDSDIEKRSLLTFMFLYEVTSAKLNVLSSSEPPDDVLLFNNPSLASLDWQSYERQLVRKAVAEGAWSCLRSLPDCSQMKYLDDTTYEEMQAVAAAEGRGGEFERFVEDGSEASPPAPRVSLVSDYLCNYHLNLSYEPCEAADGSDAWRVGPRGVRLPAFSCPVDQDGLFVSAMTGDRRLTQSTGTICRTFVENPSRLDVLLNPHLGVLKSDAMRYRSEVSFVESARRARIADVLRVHDWSYLSRVIHTVKKVDERSVRKLEGGQGGALGETVLLDSDTPLGAMSLESALHACGAVLTAIDDVFNPNKCDRAFVAVRPPGHHLGVRGGAQPDNAMTQGVAGEVTDDDRAQGSQGFCLINNVAVGAAYAKYRYGETCKKVAIVDFDAHHGNGTEQCVRAIKPYNRVQRKMHHTDCNGETLDMIATTPEAKIWSDLEDHCDVLFVSLHGYDHEFYPGTGYRSSGGMSSLLPPSSKCPSDGDMPAWSTEFHADQGRHQFDVAHDKDQFILNLPLAKGSGSKSVRKRFLQQILPALEAFSPDIIFLSAGFDAHRCDPVSQGMLELDCDDYAWITRLMIGFANDNCAGRIISVLEGGYDTETLGLSYFSRAVQKHVELMSSVPRQATNKASSGKHEDDEVELLNRLSPPHLPMNRYTGDDFQESKLYLQRMSRFRDCLIQRSSIPDEVEASLRKRAGGPQDGALLKRPRVSPDECEVKEESQFDDDEVRVEGKEGEVEGLDRLIVECEDDYMIVVEEDCDDPNFLECAVDDNVGFDDTDEGDGGVGMDADVGGELSEEGEYDEGLCPSVFVLGECEGADPSYEGFAESSRLPGGDFDAPLDAKLFEWTEAAEAVAQTEVEFKADSVDFYESKGDDL
eukprot:GHVH01005015.1.p1 GENE.GHVH01005015.1~~GHVH01005015.1.p1  ORF type:complete len:1497 (+),score=311.85 GHVH01005015.1:188-4492(+)